VSLKNRPSVPGEKPKPSPAIASCVRLAVAAASAALPEGLGKPLSLSGWWCNSHLEKSASQWDGLSHILWKIKNV